MTLPALNNGRIDLHDNGPSPARGKTRWGLLIDLNGSKDRWNINFQVITDDAFLALADNAKLSDAQKARVLGLMEAYVEQELHAEPLVLIAHGKRNLRAGTGTHKLVADYDVLALLDLRKGSQDPSVALVWGDENYFLNDFYVPVSSNDTIVARHDLKADRLEQVK